MDCVEYLRIALGLVWNVFGCVLNCWDWFELFGNRLELNLYWIVPDVVGFFWDVCWDVCWDDVFSLNVSAISQTSAIKPQLRRTSRWNDRICIFPS